MSDHITRDMTNDLDPENEFTRLLQIRKDDRDRAWKEHQTRMEQDSELHPNDYYDLLKSNPRYFSSEINDWEMEQLTCP